MTEALARLGEGLDLRDHAMLFAGVDPALDPLHGDPEFERLLAAVWSAERLG